MKSKVPYNVLLLLFAFLFVQCSNDTGELANNEQPFSAALVEDSLESTEHTEPNEPLEKTELQITDNRDNAITSAVEKASNSVVSIMVTAMDRPSLPRDELFRHFFGDRFQRDNTRMGSGFIISDDGLVVTNQHVVGNNPAEITISTTYGTTYEAELIGSDELTDVALLKIQSDDPFPFIQLSDSDDVRVGEWAILSGIIFSFVDLVCGPGKIVAFLFMNQ